jgi:hypothetical protein
MSVAEQKRENNIAEYIIHMYQTEDLIRAYEFDLELIKSRIVANIPGDEAKKKNLAKWYDDAIADMKKQGLEKSGHLAEVQEIVAELSSIHKELQSTDNNFEEVHNKSKAHIEKSKAFAKGQIDDEVQICLNGVYGLLILRMEGKNIAPELMESINAFGDILSYLSFKYKQRHFLNEN